MSRPNKQYWVKALQKTKSLFCCYLDFTVRNVRAIERGMLNRLKLLPKSPGALISISAGLGKQHRIRLQIMWWTLNTHLCLSRIKVGMSHLIGAPSHVWRETSCNEGSKKKRRIDHLNCVCLVPGGGALGINNETGRHGRQQCDIDATLLSVVYLLFSLLSLCGALTPLCSLFSSRLLFIFWCCVLFYSVPLWSASSSCRYRSVALSSIKRVTCCHTGSSFSVYDLPPRRFLSRGSLRDRNTEPSVRACEYSTGKTDRRMKNTRCGFYQKTSTHQRAALQSTHSQAGGNAFTVPPLEFRIYIPDLQFLQRLYELSKKLTSVLLLALSYMI